MTRDLEQTITALHEIISAFEAVTTIADWRKITARLSEAYGSICESIRAGTPFRWPNNTTDYEDTQIANQRKESLRLYETAATLKTASINRLRAMAQ